MTYFLATMNKNIIIISFFLSYIKYYFLTGSVICSLAVLLFVLLNLEPYFSFDFFSYFSLLDPAYSTGTFSMGIPEVMKIFSLMSLVIMLVSYVLRFASKKIFNITFEFSLRVKLLFFVTMITLTYIISFILIKLDNALDNSFYYVFVVFYVFNLVSLILYFLIDALMRRVNNFGSCDV